jgi:hypothetical protein
MIETIGFALIEISDNATFIIVMLLAIGEIRYIKKRRDSLVMIEFKENFIENDSSCSLQSSNRECDTVC